MIKFFVQTLLFTSLMSAPLYSSSQCFERQESCFSQLTRKYFRCFYQQCPQEETFLHKTRNLSLIEMLPPEILWKILVTLNPRRLKQVSSSCQRLKEIIADDFWTHYLKVHQIRRWSPDISADRVAFAHLLYQEGHITAASRLGLPQALKKIKEEKVKKKQDGRLPERHYSSYFKMRFDQRKFQL